MIGGTTPEARNLISGNAAGLLSGLVGISINSSHENTVQGNYIGTNASGLGALGNGAGIAINGSNANVIGGTTPEERNVISGNLGDGVSISGTLSNDAPGG